MSAVLAESVTEPVSNAQSRPVPARTPFIRVLRIEMRKMFDTRSGFWLMASIGLLSIAATIAVIVLSDRDEVTFNSFSGAVGIPMAIVLPVIGALAVTSEWSQRTGLTTFTLVPSRSKVLTAKFINVLLVGAVGMAIAMGVGATGNIVNQLITGNEAVWDIPLDQTARIVLGTELGMLLGFALGLLLRNPAAAVVAYFVMNFVLPPISGALSDAQQWWADNAGWFDINETRFLLYETQLTSTEWAQLAVTTGLWIFLPLLIGLRLTMRAEVK